MNTTVNTIEAILRDELRLHRDLLRAAQDMGEAIKSKEIGAVQSLTGRYDELVGEIEQLEEQRLAACDQFAAEHDLPQRHVSLRMVLSRTASSSRENMRDLQKALKEIINDLTRVNMANRILMEESLRAFSKTVELRATASVRKNGYGRTGALDTKPIVRPMVNQKA